MRTKIFLGAVFVLALVASVSGVVVETVITNGLFEPRSVAVGSDGSVYITDTGNHRIIKYSPSSAQVSVFAGLTGISGTNDGAGLQARFNGPAAIIPARGGLVVSDTYNHTIRFINYSGVVTTLAGIPTTPGLQDGAGVNAKFRFPIGLAVDNSDNIYIADSKNNAIRVLDTNNVVSTLATGFNYPAALAFDGTNILWVADKLNHQIKTVNISTGVITDIAGIKGQSGFLNDLISTNTLFNSPQGLLFLGGTTGLLIADSENHIIRRLYFNPTINGYSVETFIGITGVAGKTDGDSTIATFNTPIGMAFDEESGGFYVVDSKGYETEPGALRRVQLFAPPSQISTPQIVRVYMVNSTYGSVTASEAVDGLTFNNNIVLAIKAETGVETYYTYGPTPASQFETNSIPDPDPKSPSALLAPAYEDGADSPPISLITGGYPDVTIKAISAAKGRKSSPITRARVIFKTGRPVIDGDNAAGFRIYTITDKAIILYTTDGTDPELNATNVFVAQNYGYISLKISSDTVLKARAFATGFLPSDVVSKTFSATNSIANKISFGFDATLGEEASCKFIAAPGQSFNIPITLSLVPSPSPLPTIYSLQYGITITNSPFAPLPTMNFVSLLKKPKEGEQGVYLTIPPAFYYSGDITNTVITSNMWGQFFLGVLWMERYGQTNLYNTKNQDLITYSMAHNTLFLSSDRKVITGSLILNFPPGTPTDSKYQIQIIRPSATSDGISQDVFIDTPTNGSFTAGAINSIKEITIGDVSYLVGDVAPFRWFNGGDFGDGYLLNNDVMEVFQSAAYAINSPPKNSDMYDALDSCCVATNGANIPSVVLFNGNDTTINTIAMGDGSLDIYDIIVTYRRSIDPNLTWFKRYYTSTGRVWTTVGATNISRNSLKVSQKSKSLTPTEIQDICFSADDVVAVSGQTVDVPIRVEINGDLPLKVFLLNLSIEPLDGSPQIEQPAQFIPSSQIGTPGMTMSKWTGNYSAAWLNPDISGILSNGIVGTLRFTIPTSADQNAAYAINFMKISAGGFNLRGQNIGVVTTTPRATSVFNDGIPDIWRLRYFGTISNLLSQADADADGDGISNILEYKAGTNPVDIQSKFELLSEKLTANCNLKLSWNAASGKKYIVEAADSLFSTNWTIIASNLTGRAGMCNFIETNAADSKKFYRVRVSE
ncbi:MAG TPA: chitobiase/beta-hexosaminidase C-terminal domain-containing protein [Verrucomicrobiota bacterium]|nr:chitobiase/beta-hexosaminidase C-terminal domain-containing protein [Verrucomicrobiota bacterium]